MPSVPPALGRRYSQIFWFVALSPSGVMKAQIYDMLYADDADGGPDTRCIDTYISQLNTMLRQHGLCVRREIPHKPHSRFNLRRLDNHHIFLPLV